MDDGRGAPQHRGVVPPPGSHIAHVHEVVERLRQMLERFGERVGEDGEGDLSLSPGDGDDRVLDRPLDRARDVLGLEEDHAIGGPRVALDDLVVGRPVGAVVDEVERDLPRERRVERVDDLLRVAEGVGAVDGDEGDRGAVRPLLARLVRGVRGDAPVHDDAVGADHRAVHEGLHEPGLVRGRNAVLDRHLPREGARVGEQPHAAARERRAGEVPGERVDRGAQLVGGGHHDRLGDRHTGILSQPLEARLVVEAREVGEAAGVQLHALGEVGDARGEVEDLLERGDDHVDVVRAHIRADRLDEGIRLESGRRCDEVPGEEARVVADGAVVRVAREDGVPDAAEFSHQIESEGVAGTGDERAHGGTFGRGGGCRASLATPLCARGKHLRNTGVGRLRAWVTCSTVTAPRWRRARPYPASRRSTRCSVSRPPPVTRRPRARRIGSCTRRWRR